MVDMFQPGCFVLFPVSDAVTNHRSYWVGKKFGVEAFCDRGLPIEQQKKKLEKMRTGEHHSRESGEERSW